MSITSLFQLNNLTSAMPLVFALILLVILVISFRSRAVVFCQYLEAMTGIRLKPSEVRKVFDKTGRNGVREMFLDLIIREDLKDGPVSIPDEQKDDVTQKDEVAVN
ncbi:MAG TPA: hypothetical protein VF505_08670 [Thermoanaerobaculia bacterium]